MKKNLLPVVLIAGLIVVGIFLYIQDSTKTDKVADKDIKIGIILGFTGPIESLAPVMAKSAELAIDEVNKSGELSKLPHPDGLGSPLTNCFITTDFSESLIELVTPKFDGVFS